MEKFYRTQYFSSRAARSCFHRCTSRGNHSGNVVLQREGEEIKRERNKEVFGKKKAARGVYLTTSVYTAMSNHTPVI